MNKRLRLQCWNCPKTYFHNLETVNNTDIDVLRRDVSQQTLIVSCPYCGAEAVVDLRPYKKQMKTVIRGEDKMNQGNNKELNLPDILPTRKPE